MNEKNEIVVPDLINGLSQKEVQKQKEKGNTNYVKNDSVKPYWKIIFENVFTFFNVLMFSIALLFIFGVGITAIGNISFILIVIINILIGTIQECRAKRMVQKLKLMTTAKVSVIRDGKEIEILPEEIVLGDLIKLKAGEQIPADCVILSGFIEANEALLTGESDAIKKNINDFLYAGSFVSSGSCLCYANKVGENTYIAGVENKTKEFKKPKSKLMNEITGIIRKMTYIVIPLGLLTFWNALIATRGENISNAISKGGTAMVGMIPSGMMLLSSVAMATGVIKLAGNKTLVKELYSVESLARVNVLCLDKTGTLTDGTMTVEESVIFENRDNLNKIISTYLNSFDANNQTSLALINKYGNEKYFEIGNKIDFSSKRKYSAVEINNKTYILGAPEYITTDENILNQVNEKTKNGLRCVVLFESPYKINNDEISKKRKAIAMFVLRDNIRPQVKKTMKWFSENDVEIRVISGDNINTVSYIAKKSGIPNWDKAVDLSKIDEKDLKETILNNYIFGRVSPEQKALIVDILHEQKKTVAITGDGVNDILAMKKSDCSVAMANGSPATRNIANVVLLDSNFDNMPKTVMEGRRVVNNIQRSSTLFLMKDFFFMFLSIFCILIGMTFPIETSVMGIVNIFITGFASLVLSIEPSYTRIDGSFIKNVFAKAIPAGFFMFMPCLIILCMAIFKSGFDMSVADAIIRDSNQVPVMGFCIIIAGFVVFYKICKPFNLFRVILYLVVISLAALMLCAFPEFFLNNSTSFWGDFLKEYQTLDEIISAILDRLFSFTLYKTFAVKDWILICSYLVSSFLLYSIADFIITKMLRLKMFSIALYDDENN